MSPAPRVRQLPIESGTKNKNGRPIAPGLPYPPAAFALPASVEQLTTDCGSPSGLLGHRRPIPTDTRRT
jgi:hypothetical protein